ncbi:MAG: PEP-utilizing enzyme [Neomegalonema sp.]|nr:PEP-utilizing enzyme [Neomegalonema sp.]
MKDQTARHVIVGGRQAAEGGLFVLGAPLPRAAEARLGAKGAALAALAAQSAPAPAGVIIDAADCDELSGPHAAEAARMLEAAIFAAAPELVGAPLAVRLSPRTPVANLAPALLGVCGVDAEAQSALARSSSRYGAAPDDLAASLLMMMEAWRGPRALRRRMAAGAEPDCALIVQRFAPKPHVFVEMALFDRETGAPAPSARRATNGSALGPMTPLGAEDDASVAAAISLAEQAQAAVGAPLELDLAADDDGGAWIVTARPFVGAAQAMVAAAVALVEDGQVSRDDALLAIPADRLTDLLHARVVDVAERALIARGLAASPGAASGRLAFDSDQAAAFAKGGEPVILARIETTPEDVHGMSAAAGVLTARGGLTSHAAVVARGLGLPAIVGASELRFEGEADGSARLRMADGSTFAAGDWITLDAAQGVAFAGRANIQQGEPTGAFKTLMSWADDRRRMRVRANADTPQEVETAARMGVDGVGLCRTEHMFFAPERVLAMRRMIMADEEQERRLMLDQLLPMQRADFEQMFEITLRTAGREAPTTIRLLDPPLHEFLPRDDRGVAALAQAIGAPKEKVARRVRDLREENPMLGKRGCRVGVEFPEIYEMQARAIFEAAITVGRRLRAEDGAQSDAGDAFGPRIEIMIPLVSAARELDLLKSRIDAVAEDIRTEFGERPRYCVGVMVETPRAALRADALAPLCGFFSFGTNDLTQMTYGLSRDDAGRLMRTYVERGVFEADPFSSLDQEGVGHLIEIGVQRGREVNPKLVIGICGEHGGDPATIAFCERAGFDYVSCSPFRTPIARLAAAQAAIRAETSAAAENEA